MPDRQDERHHHRWHRWAKAAYERVPLSWRWLLRPLIYGYRMYDEIRPRFWIAESCDSPAGAAPSVLCAACGHDRHYLLHQFLGATCRECSVGRRWLWDIPKGIASEGHSCGFVIVRTLGRFRRLMKSGPWYDVPGWVTGEVNLPLDPAVLQSDTLRSDLRRIRKNALSYHVTKNTEHFNDFYGHMYVPYVTQAHGDSAVILPHETMRAYFKNCELLRVLRAGQPIAAVLIAYDQPIPRLCSMGIRDARREFVRDGAIGALYHFALGYLQEKGFTKACFGLSRGFLLDGVLQYKRKFGMRLSRAGNEWFAMRILSDGPATRGMLRHVPLVIERDGLLFGVVFLDTDTGVVSEEDFLRLDKRFFVEGLSRLLVVLLNDSMPIAAIPPALAERIAVCHISDMVR